MARNRDTKKLILDAAEELFSDRNFEAVSVREITGKANVQLALASYHFTNKQALFEEVIARRAEALNLRRREALRAVQQKDAWAVEDVLAAFTRPYMEYCIGPEPGWRFYSRLIAQIAQSDQWLPLIERHFNPTALIFADALCEVLPDAPRDHVLRAFVFSIQLMVSAFSNNGRVESLSHSSIAGDDLEGTFAILMPFLAGGFRAVPTQKTATPRRRATAKG